MALFAKLDIVATEAKPNKTKGNANDIAEPTAPNIPTIFESSVTSLLIAFQSVLFSAITCLNEIICFVMLTALITKRINNADDAVPNNTNGATIPIAVANTPNTPITPDKPNTFSYTSPQDTPDSSFAL